MKLTYWHCIVAGVNLLEVMCHPEVDYSRTVSNDVVEMLQTLGIEAARNALLKELRGEVDEVVVAVWPAD
jgi:DNA-directed RNA polymerase II subunit RPB1